LPKLAFNRYKLQKTTPPMQISTQQLYDAVAAMSEGFRPSEKTLKFIKEFAYTYRVKDGQAYSLN
jgi:hypothetical protein